ncbi:hypothetical protein SAMN04487967_1645 [Natronorubrum sediminis]|uniref:Tat (Twin-arginine translocation) pathway signal sequence n=1 Tax=Natronorubrum sediminis TaxID=640943 RepID=A0A1H6FUR3_9EURY|nr:hypothetical protein [Natronorubrum sediminis]SEH14529.1 hypothetical protein SAMN04487967_1645 [Natronorubrum sediminis]
MASDEDHDPSGVERRTYLRGITAAGAASAVGLGGLSAVSGSTQQEAPQQNQPPITAEFCGTFVPGPQVRQCIACVEAQEDCDEVSPLFPLFTDLTGQCFTPDEIPEGADYVTLKAGQFCYVAPVEEGVTTFCLPPGSPDISNATFYECDSDDPQPALMDFKVTCDEITVTTMNIDDGTELTAEVTFLDADGEESTQTFTATVQNNTATFTLPGDLNPTRFILTLNDLVLDDQHVVAQDAPCTPEPPDPPEPEDPRIEALEVTCDAITITTTDIPVGETIFAQVTFVGDIVETYNVPVGADGVAVVPLPGDLDPSFLQIVYDGDILFNANVQAIDAPCAEVPPEPPKPPKPPKKKKKGKKKDKKKDKEKLERKKRAYEKKKRECEKTKKKHEKGRVDEKKLEQKRDAYEKKKREYEKLKCE